MTHLSEQSVGLQKHRMRASVKHVRGQLSSEHWTKWSQQICGQIKTLETFKQARTVMLYRAVRNEADLDALFAEYWRLGKRTAVPRVEGEMLVAHYVCDLRTDFQTGYAGILEPLSTCPIASPQDIDLVVVPGCAFDVTGNRLGWGKGFYDRFFENTELQAVKLAAAFNFQVVHVVPANADDVRMDHLVTETRVLSFTDRG